MHFEWGRSDIGRTGAASGKAAAGMFPDPAVVMSRLTDKRPDEVPA
ncbi:hypothetical protein R69927_07075 [Paraburkholderia domus]|jgi:hypothetical protein|uniref:Uncharacterized protein n=1 Tax=Paraburkholderia domus TaxID=2793075 RepID=A0A9N8N7S3_9BURK|nr:hypothetical protein R75483_07527 [Paraburkholderia domus]CAE6863404.1 hypothetical protein R70006_08203 [Paraburkholderia domus]CAE6908400.1 hypothetical protein R69749_08511 [Paraburkholderia domus]CAE6929819.1 hypothetical protein R69927_07075 [Paraburkholderia domus]CAE6934932.1 hypothetical protein R70199_05710 [Paraburkholderia domus]